MNNATPTSPTAGFRLPTWPLLGLCGLLGFGFVFPAQAQGQRTITAEQREQAQQVAQQGVPLAELAADAPDQYTVKPADTLWGISKLFLKSPGRWPQLWGMNLEQIRNPHLIYPGQRLVLVRDGDRAALKLAGAATGAAAATAATTVDDPSQLPTVKLSPRVRSEPLPPQAIASLPWHLVQPFLEQVAISDALELSALPRLLGGIDQRVMLSRNEIGYVRGTLEVGKTYAITQEPRPLRDPLTQEVLALEAQVVGNAIALSNGEVGVGDKGRPVVQPGTVEIRQQRREIGPGNLLLATANDPPEAFVPRAPQTPVDGRVIGPYGDGVQAGGLQIVALNKGKRDGLQRGHVLALWQARAPGVDKQDIDRAAIAWPDVRQGDMLVFKVFDRVAYALIQNTRAPIQPGDRFSQP
jgi:LysM repeat protein